MQVSQAGTISLNPPQKGKYVLMVQLRNETDLVPRCGVMPHSVKDGRETLSRFSFMLTNEFERYVKPREVQVCKGYYAAGIEKYSLLYPPDPLKLTIQDRMSSERMQLATCDFAQVRQIREERKTPIPLCAKCAGAIAPPESTRTEPVWKGQYPLDRVADPTVMLGGESQPTTSLMVQQWDTTSCATEGETTSIFHTPLFSQLLADCETAPENVHILQQ